MAQPFRDARLALARNRQQLRGPAKARVLDWLEAWPANALIQSNQQIAEAAGVSRATVVRVMSLLERWQIVENLDRGGGCLWKMVDGQRRRIGRAARRVAGHALNAWRRFKRELNYVFEGELERIQRARRGRQHARRGPPA